MDKLTAAKLQAARYAKQIRDLQEMQYRGSSDDVMEYYRRRQRLIELRHAYQGFQESCWTYGGEKLWGEATEAYYEVMYA